MTRVVKYFEFNGCIFKFDEPCNYDEAWFIVKNIEKYPQKSWNEMRSIAHIYHSIKKLGCSYADDIMSLVQEMSKNVFH